MKSLKKILLIVFVMSFISGFCYSQQDTVNVLYYYKTHYIFSEGFWVYSDTASGETDSISVSSVQHGFYGPNPVEEDFREYYKVVYYSHTNDSMFNDFFLNNLWRVNGGGQWGELGQPVMLANNKGTNLGGYNGFKILEIQDSLVIGSNTFYDVAWCHITETLQYQHEFSFDTDLYFTENIGIVRKSYTDDSGVNHSWDLVNWDVGVITENNGIAIEEETVCLYPNPTRDIVRIKSDKAVKVEIMNPEGELLLESSKTIINMSSLASGIYFARIITPEKKLKQVVKIIKY